MQPEGRGREGRRRGRHVQVRCDGQVRHHVASPAREMVQGIPRGRRRGAEAQAQGTAEGVRGRGKAAHARAAARAQGAAARGRGGVPKKRLFDVSSG
jgi:regulator of protease activity HflC (stomatin/prohibitin superfamily)